MRMKLDAGAKNPLLVFTGGGLSRAYTLDKNYWTEIEARDVAALNDLAKGAKVPLVRERAEPPKAEPPRTQETAVERPKRETAVDGDTPRKEDG